MHFPLRGEAIVKTRELRDLMQVTPGPNKHESLLIVNRNFSQQDQHVLTLGPE